MELEFGEIPSLEDSKKQLKEMMISLMMETTRLPRHVCQTNRRKYLEEYNRKLEVQSTAENWP